MNYTVRDISQCLIVSEEQVRRWCRNGKLKSVKYSKKEGYIIEELDFIEFLDNHPKYKKVFDLSAKLSTQKISKLYSLEKQLEKKKREIVELEIAIRELKDSE